MKITILLFTLFLLVTNGISREITDMVGKKVEIPQTISRVFASSPPSTYIVYTIDPSLIVGLNFNHAKGNNESSGLLDERFMALPIVGGLQGGGSSIQRETLLSLHPDVVLSWNNSASGQLSEDLFSSSKIPTLNVEVENIEDLPKAYDFLGNVLYQKERTDVLSAYATSNLEKTKAIVKLHFEKRAIVYYAEGADGLATECDQSFHYQAIKFAGGINPHLCYTKSGMGMEKMSLEQVILYNPDVIIAQEREFFDSVYTNPKWQYINAVKHKRVYLIPKMPFNWIDRPPSFMRLLGVRWLTHILYNTPNFDELKVEIKEFYKLFLRVDLNDAQVNSLLGIQ